MQSVTYDLCIGMFTEHLMIHTIIFPLHRKRSLDTSLPAVDELEVSGEDR